MWSAVDHSTLDIWLMKLCSGCINLNDQARSSRLRTVEFVAVLQTIEPNLASSTWIVSGEHGIPKVSVIRYLHDFSKWNKSSWTVLHLLSKYWKTHPNTLCLIGSLDKTSVFKILIKLKPLCYIFSVKKNLRYTHKFKSEI